MSVATSKPPRTDWPAPDLDVLLAQRYANLLLRDLRGAHLVSTPPPAALPEPAPARPREEPVVRLATLLARERSVAPARPGGGPRENSQVALVEADPHLRVRSLNTAAARILGLAPAAARGLLLGSLLRPDEPSALGAALLARLAEGEPVALRLACTHDGGTINVEWICLPEITCAGRLSKVTVLLRPDAALPTQ